MPSLGGTANDRLQPALHFGGKGDPGVPPLTPKGPIRRALNRLQHLSWKLQRGVERVIDVVKWALLSTIGLFAFLPVPEKMRAFIEQLFLRGPIKSPKLSSQRDEALKNRIQEISFNMGQFRQELKRSGLGYDPKQDNIRLSAWFIPGQPGKPCIVYSHGRGSNVSHHEGLLKSWMERGYNVFIYDYPNYGRSEGKPTEQSLYKSGLAASLFVQRHLGTPVENQVLMGNSLGSVVAAETVDNLKKLDLKPKALALASSFPSVKEAFVYNRDKFGFLGKLLNEKKISLDLNVEKALAKNTDVPVLMVQGKADKRTPVSMIQGMLDRLKKEHQDSREQVKTAWVDHVQHCIQDKDFPAVVEATEKFIQSVDQSRANFQVTA